MIAQWSLFINAQIISIIVFSIMALVWVRQRWRVLQQEIAAGTPSVAAYQRFAPAPPLRLNTRRTYLIAGIIFTLIILGIGIYNSPLGHLHCFRCLPLTPPFLLACCFERFS